MKKNNYYFEAINPLAPPVRGPASVANRAKIDAVSKRQDGSWNIHVNFQGNPKVIPIEERTNKRTMMFRNEMGYPVEAKEVIKVLSESSPDLY